MNEVEVPQWWRQIYGKDAPDENDYVAVIQELRRDGTDYETFYDEPELWVDLLEAAVGVVTNRGGSPTHSPDLMRLVNSVQALMIQLAPLPEDPMDRIARRHYGPLYDKDER